MIRLILFVASLSLPLISPAAAQADFDRSITVAGAGTVQAAPDIAIVLAGVTTQGKTAQSASESNNKAMAAVLDGLKQSGVAEKDIRTSSFSIQPVYEPAPHNGRVAGFRVANNVSVTVRAIDRIAEVIDRMISAGANQMSGIQFVVSQASVLRDKALAEAVADARRKADILAKAAGVQLGRAIAISEDGSAPPRAIMFRAAPAAAATPIAAGEETLHASVTVTFELQH